MVGSWITDTIYQKYVLLWEMKINFFFLLDIFFIYISNAIPKAPYTQDQGPLLPLMSGKAIAAYVSGVMDLSLYTPWLVF